uniref:Uncharacterized protein n=1 Tax=Anguilla anguilla TaxID=7936 RepID=A0A0E9RL19_ANGAN
MAMSFRDHTPTSHILSKSNCHFLVFLCFALKIRTVFKKKTLHRGY